MRRSNYRLVLPEGPLRRFRLPESFGDEARTGDGGSQSIPVVAGLGWLGVCLCSWSLAAGIVDPAAFFDKTWQLPSDEAGQTLAAGVFAPERDGNPSSSLSTSRPARAAERAPALLASPPPASHRTPLPKVTFPAVQAHSGGWGAAREMAASAESFESELATAAAMSPSAEAAPRIAAASERTARTGDGNAGASLGQMVRELVADTPGLPRPVSPPANDPFEADFGAASLPRLHGPEAPDAPVALRPRDVPRGESAASGAGSDARVAAAGEPGAVSWNGGCQRAFDASVQHIGDQPPGKDASRADYTRALRRLDVARCGPRAHTRVEVCVAVRAGRAAGVTVHTTPSTPGLGECLMRQVRGLGFPASGGTDLVRTQFQVD